MTNEDLTTPRIQVLTNAYAFFNQRDIESVLAVIHPSVRWANGWESGYLMGREEVSAYWTRQWQEVDPVVEPLQFDVLPGNSIRATVHQRVHNKNGELITDGIVYHTYTFAEDLIAEMSISHPAPTAVTY